jgi:cytochrome c oxidase subunit 2
VLRRRWARYARLALLGGALLLSLTSCSSSSIEAKLRFGWPTGVTKQGEKMRVLWTWSSVAALIVGVITWGLIFWACGRYRKKNDELPRQTKYNLRLEIIYSIIPFFIIAGLFYYTVVTENYVNKLSKNPDVKVQVDAFKWNWQFEYKTYKGAPINFTGTTQSASTVGSSTEIPVLVIPEGQTVQFDEHSEDVVHAFWVPEFLFKRDVIPYDTNDTNRDNKFEITATSTGSFVGRCAELCGTYHSQMNFEVRVVTPAQFQTYIKTLSTIGPNDPARQSKALLSISDQTYATTTHPFNTNRDVRSASK